MLFRSLRAVLEAAGFEVEYASYWNMILFLPAATMRLLGRSGESALALPRLIDAVFYFLVCIDTVIMRVVPLPFGTGIVCIARKTSSYGE